MILIDRINGKGRLVVSSDEHTHGPVAELYKPGLDLKSKDNPGRDIGFEITALPHPVVSDGRTFVATIGTPGRTTFSITDQELEILVNSPAFFMRKAHFLDAEGHQEDMGSTEIRTFGKHLPGDGWPLYLFGVRGYIDHDSDESPIFAVGPYPDEAADLEAMAANLTKEDRALLVRTIGPRLRAAGHYVEGL